jgi:hypothetical protein
MGYIIYTAYMINAGIRNNVIVTILSIFLDFPLWIRAVVRLASFVFSKVPTPFEVDEKKGEGVYGPPHPAIIFSILAWPFLPSA